MTKKDLYLSIVAGFFIGLLFLPVFSAAKPELYGKVAIFIIPFFLIGTPFGLYISHLISKKFAVFWQIAKFGVTGVLNVLVDLGFLTLLAIFFRSYFGIDSKNIIFGAITFYPIYKSCSFIIAAINSYYWNKYWTFHKEGEKGSEFIQFFIVSIVGFVVNVFVASLVFKAVSASIGISSDQAGLLGAAAGSIAGMTWNFLGYKFIVFKK